jgi:Tfp pilus assembly protein PilN
VKAVNLIPTEQRGPGKAPAASAAAPSSSDGDGFGAYAILGLLAFAVVAAALYVMATNKISENKAELASVQSEAQTVQEQAASMQSFADFKGLAESRTATVRGLAEARFDWDTALDDVSRALPDDAYISSFDGTTNSGSGGSSIRGAISAPAIELVGCTTSQTDVARLMARLRNVRGVSRVSLASSVVTATQQTPVAPAPAAPAAPTSGDTAEAAKTYSEPCPKGSPPFFDMVVFFERAVVGPNAAPNTGATSATAGPTGTAGAPTGPTGTSGATTPASTTTTP